MGGCYSRHHVEEPLPDKLTRPVIKKQVRLLNSARLPSKRENGRRWRCERCQFANPHNAMSCIKCSRRRLTTQKFFEDNDDEDDDDSEDSLNMPRKSGSVGDDGKGKKTPRVSGEPRILRLFKQASLPAAFGGTPKNHDHDRLAGAAKPPRHSSSLLQHSAFMLAPIFGGFQNAQKQPNGVAADVAHHIVVGGGDGGAGGDIIMLPAITSNVPLAGLGTSENALPTHTLTNALTSPDTATAPSNAAGEPSSQQQEKIGELNGKHGRTASSTSSASITSVSIEVDGEFFATAKTSLPKSSGAGTTAGAGTVSKRSGLEVLLRVSDADKSREPSSRSYRRSGHKSSEDEATGGDSFQMSGDESGEPGDSSALIFPPRPTGEPERVRSLMTSSTSGVALSVTKESYRKFEAELENRLRKTAEQEGKVRPHRVDGLRESIALPYTKHLGSDESDKQFHYVQIIGRGGFGRVVRVKSKLDKKYYAMKITDKRLVKVLERQSRVKFENEVKMMNALDHPFIVRLIFDFETKHFIFMCMELIRGGSLHRETRDEQACHPENIKIWAAEIVLAIEYIHEKGLVYRDLKPDNVMIDEDGHMRLIDLGLVTHVTEGEKLKYIVGARGFKAPEMLKGEYGKEIDWWNLGVLLYRLYTGKHPFGEQYTADYRIRRYKNTDKIKLSGAQFSREARDLIRKLLDPNPKTRIDCAHLKVHSYFDGLDWDKVRSKSYDIPHWSKKFKPFPGRERVRFRDAVHVMKELQRQDKAIEAQRG